MTTYPTTTTQIPGPVDYIFQRTFLDDVRPTLVYFEGTTPADLSSKQGSLSYKWRRLTNLTPTTTPLSQLASGQNVSLPLRDTITPAVTDITVTLAKYGQAMFITEEVDLINYSGYADRLMKAMGRSAGMSLNRVQRNEMEDNFSPLYASAVANAGAITNALAYGDIEKTVNFLDRNGATRFSAMTKGDTRQNTAPMPPCYYGLGHWDILTDLERMPQWHPVESYAGQIQTLNGEAGRTGPVRWMLTGEASIDADTGVAIGTTGLRGTTKVDVYNSVVYGMDAIGSLGLDQAPPREIFGSENTPGLVELFTFQATASAADPLRELRGISWKAWMAAKVLSPADGSSVTKWARCIRSGATAL